VEYVLAPDPNLGPWEALSPREVRRLAAAAGLRVVESSAADAVPPRAEVEHRTRNMRGTGRAVLRGAVAAGRLVATLPGVTALFGRTRVLVLEKG
jgi:hypothetical protein